jgi:integrin alpha FG-GAP repeat containing protein 1
MVFTTCTSVSTSTGVGTDCAINIAYNKQYTLCAAGDSGLKKGVRTCRPPEDLCTADPAFSFDMNSATSDVCRRIALALTS